MTADEGKKTKKRKGWGLSLFHPFSFNIAAAAPHSLTLSPSFFWLMFHSPSPCFLFPLFYPPLFMSFSSPPFGSPLFDSPPLTLTSPPSFSHLQYSLSSLLLLLFSPLTAINDKLGSRIYFVSGLINATWGYFLSNYLSVQDHFANLNELITTHAST